MSLTKKIKAPISNEMSEFEPFFKDSMKSKVLLLDIITNYVIRRKGKQLRPMLVFLSAKLHGNVNQTAFVAASLIELLHTATLIHDDIVDEAYMRRGNLSINALWKNKISVLVGDYFLSKGLLLAINKKEFKLLEIVSDAVKEMSEGELLQIEKSKKLDITEDEYFEIITKKTATLIASCTACGTYAATKDDNLTEKMRQFGKTIGIIFQIKDDILDYTGTDALGKPTGNDIKEKKLTLPIIYVLNKLNNKEQKNILKIIKKDKKNNNDVKLIVETVKNNGGIKYAEKQMLKYKKKAISILTSFNDNDAKLSLEYLIDYFIERKK